MIAGRFARDKDMRVTALAPCLLAARRAAV